MNLKEILSISGKPGLFKTLAQTKNGVIVESLIDGKRIQAFGTDKISSLGEISIFTTGDDKPLADVLTALYAFTQGQPAPENKNDDKALRAFFAEVVPDFDSERVYTSHIRKLISWFNLMLGKGYTEFTLEEPKPLDAEAPVAEPAPNAEAAEATEPAKAAKPVKKAKPKSPSK